MFKKGLFILLGCITFALGTIGIFLPILPTTIFYILTAFFWVRSSDRLYGRFIHSNFYRDYVERPFIKKEMTRKQLFKTLGMIFVVFFIPGVLVDNRLMRISLVIVYILHVIGFLIYFRKDKRKKVVVKDIEIET